MQWGLPDLIFGVANTRFRKFAAKCSRCGTKASGRYLNPRWLAARAGGAAPAIPPRILEPEHAL